MLGPLDVDSEGVYPREYKISRLEPMTMLHLDELSSNPSCELEGWSQIALEELRKIL